MYGASNMETYLPYVKQRANGNLMYDSGNSSWSSVTTQRVKIGREGTKVYLWLIHVDVGQKPMHCSRVIILQLKINLKKLSNGKMKSNYTEIASSEVIIYTGTMSDLPPQTLEVQEAA